MRKVSRKEYEVATKKENKGCGIGCGGAILALIIMWILGDTNASGGIDTLFVVICIVALAYYILKPRKTTDIINQYKKQRHQAKQKRVHEARVKFKNSLPSNTRTYAIISKSDDNIYNLESIHGYYTKVNDTIMALLNNRQIVFINNYKIASPHYYLATVSFKPNYSVHDYTTTTTTGHGGKAKGRGGSALVGGLLFGPIGAAIGASRKRKIKGEKFQTHVQHHYQKTEHETNAYLQFVTTDFKHIKQVKLTGVKNSDYQTLDHKYMLTDLELKQLESKHGLNGRVTSGSNDIQKLEALKKLLDNKAITKQDFETEKKKIINN